MADRLAATLGKRPAALMKSHGAVAVGKDIVEAFVLANYLEENAYRQYMAMQIGKPYEFSAEEQALCREKLWTPSLFQRTWDHHKAKLGNLVTMVMASAHWCWSAMRREHRQGAGVEGAGVVVQQAALEA